ncbi:MAG TPA: HAD-IG family 5'-nucleotidase [Candidatus Dormibacteraeota bacterium]|nr:HAD-IG family 5'-nucleotidase [Candidatus Dormibacteraeota bacterium]
MAEAKPQAPTKTQAPPETQALTRVAPPSKQPAAVPREPSARALRYREHRIPRRHRVFVNRNLRMTKIRAIGFDLDHTLAHYDPDAVETLAFDLTKQKLVENKGYPREILAFPYDPPWVIRGLVVDKKRGNLLKMDYFNFVSRAYHGLTQLRSDERKRAYRSDRIRLGHENYVSVDTLFHLPEVYLYLCLVDFLEKRDRSTTLDYEKVYQDVREMIDEAHRDGTLKSVITGDLDRYIRFDPEARITLEEFRRAGKKLFLLTNSEWEYTDKLLRHILQRGKGAPGHWTELFNLVIVEAGKPDFFGSAEAPEPVPGLKGQKLSATIGHGGGSAYLQRALGASGEHILYFGDHTYGDILQSKRVAGWRTAMIVPELDREITVTTDFAKEFERLAKLSSERHQLEIEKAAMGRELRRLTFVLSENDGTDPTRRAEIAARIEGVPIQIEEMDRRGVELEGEIESLRVKIDRAYNPRWGSLFREGNESSRFGHQLKDFACVYTSRVSNFLHYPWNYYFQSPVGYMPHDI